MLASAPLHYSSDSNLELILISLGAIVAAAVVGCVPVVLAHRVHHRQFEAILAVTILWTAVAAGSVCWLIVRQCQYNTSVQQSIMEGYYDPQDQSDKPRPPVDLWCGTGVCYGLLIGWSSRRR